VKIPPFSSILRVLVTEFEFTQYLLNSYCLRYYELFNEPCTCVMESRAMHAILLRNNEAYVTQLHI
jgi:hypothetical protein